MTAKVHVHIRASNLEASSAFYEKFFGAAPVKVRAGYVKFLPDFAPVNLALSERGRESSAPPSVSHLGVQIDSTEEVLAHLGRVKAAGLPVRVEMSVNCCHANQDKFWVKDPDGIEWEVYHLNYDVEEEDEPPVRRMKSTVRGKEIAVISASTTACCWTTRTA